METQILTKEALLAAIEESITRLLGFVAPMQEEQLNAVPFAGSWTAGQLMNHVSKSINGLAGALLKAGKPAERDPGEKIEGLKKTLLDFNSKMKSPDFVLPETGPIQKQDAVEALNSAFEKLTTNSTAANLNELVEGLPTGPLTKLELLHFILYHTQRHLQQLKNIFEALNNENKLDPNQPD